MDELQEQLLKLFPQELQPPLRQVIESKEALLAAAVLSCIILVLFVSRVLFSSSQGSQIVIAGPSNSGKTTLWFTLRDQEAHLGTVASMHPNEDVFQLTTKGRKNVRVKVVDVPGHARLKSVLEQHVTEALAVVFVVDAVDFNHQKQEAAELLYDILSTPEVMKRRTPVLIACNKSDLEDQAFSVDFIKRALEKQLDIMRKTKVALTDSKRQAPNFGPSDKPFSFNSLKNPVSTCSISASKPDVETVANFITFNA